MDQMDYEYTIDDSQTNHQANSTATHQYQCHQPHPPSASNAFAPQARDRDQNTQHYDPVHDATSWFHSNSSPGMGRPFYAPTQPTPQWAPPSFLPMHNSFQAYPNVQRSSPQTSDQASLRSSRGFLEMPWNEVQAFEPLRFGYPSYSNPMNTTGETSGPPVVSSQQLLPPVAPRSQIPHLDGYRRDGQIGLNQQPQGQTATMMGLSSSIRRGAEDITTEERPAQHIPAGTYPSDSRNGHSRPFRHSTMSRINGPVEPSHPRRRTGTLDSDEDEDSALGTDVYSEFQRRQHEILFGDGLGEERSLAAMRGAIATNKRVPSKEAITSLEEVKLGDLTGNDRTCIICYNEFGVENPEGLVETPLRLPKCKHIFGDKCIKKWFEDSDSCPYCRDKLPSELSVRKSVNYDTYRATRERIQLLSQRARQSLASRYSFAEDSGSGRPGSLTTSQRALEEYENMMSRDVGSWGLAPSIRSSNLDSPERRRQARGRIGSNRAAHQLGRPTSVGSARSINPTFSHQLVAQRTPLQNPPINSQTNNHTPQRPTTPSLTRQQNPGQPGSTAQTPPRTRVRSGGESSSSSSPEAASPPIAVGSGVSMRDSQTDRSGQATSRRSLDVSAPPFEWGSNALIYLGQQEVNDINSAQQTRPLAQSNLTQNPAQFSSVPGGSTPVRRHFDGERNASSSLQMEDLNSGANNPLNTHSMFQPRWSR